MNQKTGRPNGDSDSGLPDRSESVIVGNNQRNGRQNMPEVRNAQVMNLNYNDENREPIEDEPLNLHRGTKRSSTSQSGSHSNIPGKRQRCLMHNSRVDHRLPLLQSGYNGVGGGGGTVHVCSGGGGGGGSISGVFCHNHLHNKANACIVGHYHRPPLTRSEDVAAYKESFGPPCMTHSHLTPVIVHSGGEHATVYSQYSDFNNGRSHGSFASDEQISVNGQRFLRDRNLGAFGHAMLTPESSAISVGGSNVMNLTDCSLMNERVLTRSMEDRELSAIPIEIDSGDGNRDSLLNNSFGPVFGQIMMEPVQIALPSGSRNVYASSGTKPGQSSFVPASPGAVNPPAGMLGAPMINKFSNFGEGSNPAFGPSTVALGPHTAGRIGFDLPSSSFAMAPNVIAGSPSLYKVVRNDPAFPMAPRSYSPQNVCPNLQDCGIEEVAVSESNSDEGSNDGNVGININSPTERVLRKIFSDEQSNSNRNFAAFSKSLWTCLEQPSDDEDEEDEETNYSDTEYGSTSEEESNDEQEPEVEESNDQQEPVEESNDEQEPEVEESNDEQEPEVEESNDEREPEVEESNDEQEPEVEESNDEQEPEVEENIEYVHVAPNDGNELFVEDKIDKAPENRHEYKAQLLLRLRDLLETLPHEEIRDAVPPVNEINLDLRLDEILYGAFKNVSQSMTDQQKVAAAVKKCKELFLQRKIAQLKNKELNLVEVQKKVDEAQEALKSSETTIKNQKSQLDIIFEAFQSELKCNICCDILIEPMALGCKHMFCNVCLNSWKARKESCPTCRSPITHEIQALHVQNFIEKVMTVAPEDMKESRNETLQQRAVELQNQESQHPEEHVDLEAIPPLIEVQEDESDEIILSSDSEDDNDQHDDPDLGQEPPGTRR